MVSNYNKFHPSFMSSCGIYQIDGGRLGHSTHPRGFGREHTRGGIVHRAPEMPRHLTLGVIQLETQRPLIIVVVAGAVVVVVVVVVVGVERVVLIPVSIVHLGSESMKAIDVASDEGA